MNPPTCKTCGKRTDLHDMHGHYRCWACRRELYPSVYGGDEPVNVQEAML